MRILIVDDEIRFAGLVRKHLASEGYAAVDVAASGNEALELARHEPYQLVVTDLRMPGMSGLDLLGELKRSMPGTQVVLMTAFAEVDTARAALTRGALDYLVKPFDLTELSRLVARARTNAGDEAAPEEAPFCGMIGTTPPMRSLFAALSRAAESDASVLVTGESGTGKELVARALHDLSARHRGPFVDVNCAAIAEGLIESELFGHEKGSFTGADARRAGRVETANGGTLFLDEIGEMPLALQPKLLRFLQERRYWRVGGTAALPADVRVVAATNRDLGAEVRDRHFREDLYYRLEVLTLHLPPLRERRSDIALIIRHLLRRRGLPPGRFTAEAYAAMAAADWPGNVRQLINTVERTLVLTDGAVDAPHIAACLAPQVLPEDDARPLPGLVDSERRLIERALTQAAGNKTRAAEILGITRRRLYSRLKSLGMEPGADE